jgi:hypothetical protein
VRTAITFSVAACLIVLAALATLLARDVRSWPSTLESGDAVLSTAPVRASWSPSTNLGGLSESLLGLDGQLKLRRALRLYRIGASIPARLDNANEVATARSRAQAALAAAARDSDPERASQALNLLGVLSFGAVGQGTDETQVDAAAADFSQAIRTDPSAALAKFNLELLLRSTAAHGVRIAPGTGGGFGRTGRRGAGGGIAGRGY